MKFINLVINELVKILKRKSILVFSCFAIISLLGAYGIVKVKKENVENLNTESSLYLADYEMANAQLLQKREKVETEYEKKIIDKHVEINKFILEKGVKNIMTAEYKESCNQELIKIYERLYSLDPIKNLEEYKIQKKNEEKLWKIFLEGSFEDYISFNKELLLQKYERAEITKEEYDLELQKQDLYLQYEIGKYLPENTKWKEDIINENEGIKHEIEDRFDASHMVYLEDRQIKQLEDDMLISEYRLKNNIAPYYNDMQMNNNLNSYCRYNYNNFANTISIIFIGILVIILSASSVSEEISKGTVVFMNITPVKRYQILLAKIVSIVIILVALVILISQISVLIGNIAFGVNTNNYLYVSGSKVVVMSTHIYETLGYLLRIPELIVYLLVGITLSTLTKNTAISTIITTLLFLGYPIAYKILSIFVIVEPLKYLPFSNFDLTSKILRVNTYENVYDNIPTLSIESSIVILSITAILLIITVFDSYNNKEF